MRVSFKEWFKSGSPWIWLNAGAVAISMIMVIGLLIFIAIRGLGHFWPGQILQATYTLPGEEPVVIAGEITDTEMVPARQLEAMGIVLPEGKLEAKRILLKVGNRDVYGSDFRWVLEQNLSDITYPKNVLALERHEWGNFYGVLKTVKAAGEVVADASVDEAKARELFAQYFAESAATHAQLLKIQKHDIGSINYALERLRLKERGLELKGQKTPENMAPLLEERSKLDAQYNALQARMSELYADENKNSFVVVEAAGREHEYPFAKIVRYYRPNEMGLFAKIGHYFSKIGEFLFDDPREANTEGGVFPAIYGTVLMVLLMSVMVTPFGVIAAVYLREYAKQGLLTQIIRVAVNNLAGVPSIVYGVFGLGFFVYFLGGSIDELLFPEALPSPTFGTGGLLWASITLALLTLPVVIVATEEGLARIPRSIREGSLALGATKFETLMRVVLPMASPAMMTGVILAVARAAGEVAPLMLVGVVKLAPSLPLDGNYPFLHLDQKFMHLGFHIYDVGFQSPNVEAARPLVYATALLLVAVIALLNLSAIAIRNHLREKYKALEM